MGNSVTSAFVSSVPTAPTGMSHLLPWSNSESLSTPLLDEEKEHEDSPNVTVTFSQPSRRSMIYMFASLAMNLALATAIAWTLANRASMVLWKGDPPVYSQYLSYLCSVPPMHNLPRARTDLLLRHLIASTGTRLSHTQQSFVHGPHGNNKIPWPPN